MSSFNDNSQRLIVVDCVIVHWEIGWHEPHVLVERPRTTPIRSKLALPHPHPISFPFVYLDKHELIDWAVHRYALEKLKLQTIAHGLLGFWEERFVSKKKKGIAGKFVFGSLLTLDESQPCYVEGLDERWAWMPLSSAKYALAELPRGLWLEKIERPFCRFEMNNPDWRHWRGWADTTVVSALNPKQSMASLKGDTSQLSDLLSKRLEQERQASEIEHEKLKEMIYDPSNPTSEQSEEEEEEMPIDEEAQKIVDMALDELDLSDL